MFEIKWRQITKTRMWWSKAIGAAGRGGESIQHPLPPDTEQNKVPAVFTYPKDLTGI